MWGSLTLRRAISQASSAGRSPSPECLGLLALFLLAATSACGSRTALGGRPLAESEAGGSLGTGALGPTSGGSSGEPSTGGSSNAGSGGTAGSMGGSPSTGGAEGGGGRGGSGGLTSGGGGACESGEPSCEAHFCGDGQQDPDEECDDGNAANEDDCTAYCALATCGDGFVQSGEACDDGNATEDDFCSSACTPANLQLTAGGNFACALHPNHELKCWGRNLFGALGLGDQENRGDEPSEMGDDLPGVDLGSARSAQALALGDAHSCTLLHDGSVKCWGYNGFGQLGLGNIASRGNEPGEMGDALPTVDLGSGRSARALAAGSHHTCALLDDDSVKCWGHNTSGQLGLGDEETRGDVSGEMGDALPAVDLGSGRSARAIAAGGSHTCAWLDDASIKCWGGGLSGTFGLGDTNVRGDEPGEMGDSLPAMDLGISSAPQAVATGAWHTCALLGDGSTKCWGVGTSGQLGLGDAQSRGSVPGQMGDNLPAVALGSGRSVQALALGGYRTCALLDDHTVKCWGNNSSGQLGLEDLVWRGDEPGEMGDDLPTLDLW